MALEFYKCPACGGHVEFDSKSQTMKCPYCDSEFDIEAIEQREDILNREEEKPITWSQDDKAQWEGEEASGMNVYSCKSCGGEIIAEETTGATECPYCGGPVVMSGAFEGDLRPDLVIPFKLDKKAAMAEFSKHLEGKRLLPKTFRTRNRIEEIKGVYVPFWLFDADIEATMHYTCTKTRTWSDKNYRYVNTSFYNVMREGNLSFKNVAVDGSSVIDDALMESIEPFDVSEAVDFKTAYLSGYLADKYDVDMETSVVRANQRIKESTMEAFREAIFEYETASLEREDIRKNAGDYRYALYPVWLMTTRYNGEVYTFAMNGQTGKFVGNLPAEKGAALKLFASTAGIVSALSFAVLALLDLLVL